MTVIRCTAWDLLGEYDRLVDASHAVRMQGGRTLYYGAFYVRGEQSVRLERFAERDGRLHLVTRYAPATAPVELIPIERNDRGQA